MSIEPKVSVIIPVHNGEEYLRECLDSVANQTLREFEIICIDDGSTDGSLDILREYEAADNRFQVLTQKNLFAGVARNQGLSRAKGKYCVFLDCDDLMMPSALEELFYCAEAINADVVLCSARKIQKGLDKDIKDRSCLKQHYLPDRQIFNRNSHPKYLFQISNGQPWGKIIRRELIDQNHICFPDLPRSEDIVFTYWVYCMASSISSTNSELFLHRDYAGSGSLEDSKDKYPSEPIAALTLLWKIIEELELDVLLRQTFINKVVDTVTYNLTTFHSREAFAMMYESFLDVSQTVFRIDFKNSDYFYNRRYYVYLRTIIESTHVADYLYHILNCNNTGFSDKAVIKESKSYQIEWAITWLYNQIRRSGFQDMILPALNHISGIVRKNEK